MNYPTCKKEMLGLNGQPVCPRCARERTAESGSDAEACSRGHSSQNACQRAHNYLTYGLGVIAHRLEQGEDPKTVASEALRLRDRSEEIRSENSKHPHPELGEKP